MKKKIKLLIVGKNSFISSNIFFLLKDNIHIKKVKYLEFIRQSRKFISRFNYIMNCSYHKNYFIKKYNKKFDFDYNILNKIKNLNINYIYLSSRKIYKPQLNTHEYSKIVPQDNYASNKFITENYVKKFFPKNYLILRISNIIGLRLVNNKRSHDLFLDNFISSVKKNFLISHKNEFKDFISIDQFAKIFLKIIKNNLKGTYNVSLGKKVYIKELLKWLTSSSKKLFEIRDYPNSKVSNCYNFTLNNKKLRKALNISIKKKDLKIHCLKISKIIFTKIS